MIISNLISRTNLLSLFILINTFLLSAQNMEQGISGTVKDASDQKGLESVNLILAGTKYGTISIYDGSFEINEVPEGRYELQASMVGYQPVSKIVIVKKNSFTFVTLELKQEVIAFDSVVVYGRKQQNYIATPNLEPLSLTAVTSKVTREEIARQGSVTLIDALKYVPGSLTESRGRKVKDFFSVRGQKYPYPDYAINGIWQKEFHELPYFISASDIEQVEIIRSSAALITGLSGLSGIVNIKTRSYEKTETSAEMEYGTFNSMHFHASHGGKHNNFSYATGLGYDKTDGPENKNAAEKIGNVYGRFQWQPSEKFDINASLYFLNGMREIGLAVEPATKKLKEKLTSYNQIRSTLSNVRFKYTPNSKASTELYLFYSDRKPIHKAIDMNTQDVTKTPEYDHEYGLNLIQALSLSSTNTLRFGGLYNHWIAPDGKRFYIGRPCDLETISGVITDEQIFGSFAIDAGFRWAKTYMNEYGAFDIGESGAQFKDVVPIVNEWQPSILQASLGLTWNISGSSAIFYHSALGNIKPREGSLTEDFTDPVNENRFKFDLGFQSKIFESGNITLTGFLVNQKNAISLSGGTYEQNGITLEFYQNRNEDHFGIETEIISPKIGNLFSVFANFTAMRSRAEEEGEMVKNKEFPERITNAGVFLEKYGFDLNIYAKHVSYFESSRFVAQVPNSPTIFAPLGDFFIMDLTAGYSFGSKIISRAYLKVNNLTDKRYSTVAGYPDFGRRVYFGITIRM